MLRVRNQVDIEHGLLRLHELFRTTNFKMSHSSCQLVSLYKLHGGLSTLELLRQGYCSFSWRSFGKRSQRQGIEPAWHETEGQTTWMERECKRNISRHFKKPLVIQQYHDYITVYHGTSKVAVPLDTLTNPGGPPHPYLKLETPTSFSPRGYLYWQYDRWGSLRPKWCKSLDGTTRGRCSFRLCL